MASPPGYQFAGPILSVDTQKLVQIHLIERRFELQAHLLARADQVIQ